MTPPYTSGKKRPTQGHRSGFALIATLTLMMLLSLVAVGILASLSSQNRISSQIALVAEARQQALIGLDAAIAELQAQLGPDQRVTASSGILSDSSGVSQNILGVWDSWKAPLYGQSEGRRISSTYSQGRRSMFRSWLISSREPMSLRRMESVNSLGTRSPGLRVKLLGDGTLGRSADVSSYVYADLIPMPSSGSREACFAWWISGNNQRVNIAVERRKETQDVAEILNRTWDTPAPVFTGSRSLPFLSQGADIPDPAKLLTMDTLPLCEHVSSGGGSPYFFDVTTYSYSLPVNVRDGGLKYDLNLLLNKKTLEGTPYAPRTGQDCPIVEGNDVPTPLEPRMPLGSWQNLHAFHNTWPDGSGTDSGFSARLVGNLSRAYTRLSGHLQSATTPKGDHVTYYEDRAIAGDSKAGYARTPVMVSFMGAYGLSVSQANGDSGYSPTNRSHGFVYSPYVMWWNPYNVPMRVGGKKLWSMSLPYRVTSILVWSDYPQKNNNGGDTREGTSIGGRWRRDMLMQPHDSSREGAFDGAWSGQGNCLGDDWGNYFVNAEGRESEDIVFEPGEILMFSMARGWNSIIELKKQGNNTPLGQPQAVPFVLGDNFGDLHYYTSSMFSSGSAHTVAVSYSFETRQTYANEQSTVGWKMTTRYDAEVDGKYSNNEYLHDTVGEALGPHHREAYVVSHGFDGINASGCANQALKPSRLTSKPDRFVGAEGISPNNFMLGWYDRNNVTSNGQDMTFVNRVYFGLDMQPDTPDYYAAVGIAPKSYNPSMNEGLPMFRGKDYRTKTWLHSNPALGSSALYHPDDQQRQYNPFQLAAVEMGVGMDRGVLDTPNNRNGVWGLSSVGSGGGEAVSFISTLEIPMHPPMSLAGFAGMRLKPGWYEPTGTDNFSIAGTRRMQYQAGVPGVGIGNAFADPCLPPDDVHVVHESAINTSPGTNGSLFTDFFDHGLLINDALWDQWFCSSMADVPTRQGKREVREIVEKFVHGEDDLPVSRYKLSHSPDKQQEIISRILDQDGWKNVARYLVIEGGFNVNSVSEEAWAAMLMSLAHRDLVHNANGNLERLTAGGRGVLFSRFMVSTCRESIDENSSAMVTQGWNNVRPNLRMASAWGEVRLLSPESIRDLAREMVKKVRERGPFLNMSDFINRRLDGGSDTALTGALQAAIDATDINAVFRDSSYNVQVAKEGNLYSYPKAEEGSMFTAAPGYLIQSDVLASLGNILTVRDDTFTVRAYGCVRNERKAVLAQAWCEAIVQRSVEYVDPSNAPGDAPHRSAGAATHFSELNRALGRRFRVVSFKWLDSWDI